jgi:hypothetical protein
MQAWLNTMATCMNLNSTQQETRNPKKKKLSDCSQSCFSDLKRNRRPIGLQTARVKIYLGWKSQTVDKNLSGVSGWIQASRGMLLFRSSCAPLRGWLALKLYRTVGPRSIMDGVGEHHEPQLTLCMTCQYLRIIKIACLNLSCDEIICGIKAHR